MVSFRGRSERGEHRIPVGRAKVFIHTEPYNVINWSRHGVMIGPYSGTLEAGTPFTFRFVLPMSDDDDFEFSAWAEVIRVDGLGLAARYIDLNDEVSARIDKMLAVLIPQ